MAFKPITPIKTMTAAIAMAVMFMSTAAQAETPGQFKWWTEKQANGHRWVKAQMLIQATPDIVWQNIHNEQNADQDLVYRKVLSKGVNDVVSEQKLHHLPFIGTAVSTMHTTEVPLKRIDYEMVKSDRFKALEGSWVLNPGPNKSTYLELSSYCDIGIPVPRPIREGITVKKLEKRLINVKKNSEYAQVQIAEDKPQSERLN
ncbi:MAG TPA: hypothetical protein V6C89_13330 [Drouetiella sp.]|jgi:hypothetical protein